jgi:hypothetical protein
VSVSVLLFYYQLNPHPALFRALERELPASRAFNGLHDAEDCLEVTLNQQKE